VVIDAPGSETNKQLSDSAGRVTCELSEAGLVAVRARHVETASDTCQGSKYSSVRHYVTLTLPPGSLEVPVGELPKLPPLWDAKTNNLRSTNTVFDEWTRVGKWDLPKRLLSVETRDKGRRNVREIRFSGHRLLDGSKTSAN
jgi:hypothetical protein